MLFSLEQSSDGGNQSFAAGPQLTDSMLRDLLKETFSSGQEGNEDPAAVVAAAGATHVAVGFQAVDELDGAVVLQGQALGQRLDGGFAVFRQATNGQGHQGLLGFEADGAGFGVALAKKMADAVA